MKNIRWLVASLTFLTTGGAAVFVASQRLQSNADLKQELEKTKKETDKKEDQIESGFSTHYKYKGINNNSWQFFQRFLSDLNYTPNKLVNKNRKKWTSFANGVKNNPTYGPHIGLKYVLSEFPHWYKQFIKPSHHADLFNSYSLDVFHPVLQNNPIKKVENEIQDIKKHSKKVKPSRYYELIEKRENFYHSQNALDFLSGYIRKWRLKTLKWKK